jgi:putative salt-induced outer membrane protein YdiY
MPANAALAARRLLALAVTLLSADVASAQIISRVPPPHVPPARAPIVVSHPPARQRLRAPRPRWSGKAEASYVATTGNADDTTARIASEVQYRPGRWTVFLRAAFLTSASEEAGHRHRIDGIMRTSRELNERIELFSQIVYLENTFAGLASSFYPLGGLAFALIDTAPHALTTRVGLGFGQEDRLGMPGFTFASADVDTSYRWTLSKTAKFKQDATFTRNLGRPDDWRLANMTAVAAALNSLFSLELSHSFNYFNVPVPGFERVDTVTSASLVATF